MEMYLHIIRKSRRYFNTSRPKSFAKVQKQKTLVEETSISNLSSTHTRSLKTSRSFLFCYFVSLLNQLPTLPRLFSQRYHGRIKYSFVLSRHVGVLCLAAGKI